MYTGLAVVPAEEGHRIRLGEGVICLGEGAVRQWVNIVILGAEHVEWRATEALQQDMPGDLCAVAEFIGGRSATLACWKRLVSP